MRRKRRRKRRWRNRTRRRRRRNRRRRKDGQKEERRGEGEKGKGSGPKPTGCGAPHGEACGWRRLAAQPRPGGLQRAQDERVWPPQPRWKGEEGGREETRGGR